MRFVGYFADIINRNLPEPLYGIPDPKPATPEFNATPIIIISAICVGVVAGIIMLVKKSLKNREINNAQALYGPPSFFAKKNKVEPPEDLYGCPRPDEMDEEPTDEIKQ